MGDRREETTMYLNPLNSPKEAFEKGLKGENAFPTYCKEHRLGYVRAPEIVDYQDKIDFFIWNVPQKSSIHCYSVAVKANFNALYDNFVVELEQISEGRPQAWLYHDKVNFVAFFYDDHKFLLIEMETLREHMKTHAYQTKIRFQSLTKGTYVIAFVPRKDLEALQYEM